MDDNSALTHLATGRLILDHGIPRHDPFSFTAHGEPWTVYSWLASVGMALADRAGDGNGIQLARAALTCGLAALMWRLTRPAVTLAGRISAVTPVLIVGTYAWSERPLLLALVLMGLVVWLAEEEHGSPWLLAGLMWVWVNVHGSFPLGVVYLGVRLGGRLLDGTATTRQRRLLSAAVVGVLLGGINPLGPRLLVFPLELLQRHDLLERVQEWRSPDFSRPANLTFLAALLMALLLSSRRRSYEDGLVAVVFGAAACLAVRNVPVAMIVLAPALSRGLKGLGTVSGGARSIVNGVAAAGMLAVAAVLTVAALQERAYDLDRYPVAHLDWMEAQGLLDRRVATQDFVGNFIISRRGEEANVFFDDRFDMYPRRIVSDAIALLDGREGWQRRLDAYRIDAVLWERSRPLAGLLALDPGWAVVRRDKDWIVAVRQRGATVGGRERGASEEAPL